MKIHKTCPESVLKQLQQLDTCTLSNAVERFELRTRNEGFVNGSIHCQFPGMTPRAGYAVTARIRTSSTPMTGECYYDRDDWWSYVETIPVPRFIVLEDVDRVPGVGALIGEVHAAICIALNCTAVLTNGAVRDLMGVQQSGLQLFAGSIAVSHSYAHIIDFGEVVEVGGLRIKPGNLLHGDRHGVLDIPLEIASELPDTAREILAGESELIGFCEEKRFTSAELHERIHRLAGRVSFRRTIP